MVDKVPETPPPARALAGLLADLLERVAGDGPLVVVVDDAHCVDLASRHLLDRVGGQDGQGQGREAELGGPPGEVLRVRRPIEEGEPGPRRELDEPEGTLLYLRSGSPLCADPADEDEEEEDE